VDEDVEVLLGLTGGGRTVVAAEPRVQRVLIEDGILDLPPHLIADERVAGDLGIP